MNIHNSNSIPQKGQSVKRYFLFFRKNWVLGMPSIAAPKEDAALPCPA
jgi:hypothetical protein